MEGSRAAEVRPAQFWVADTSHSGSWRQGRGFLGSAAGISTCFPDFRNACLQNFPELARQHKGSDRRARPVCWGGLAVRWGEAVTILYRESRCQPHGDPLREYIGEGQGWHRGQAGGLPVSCWRLVLSFRGQERTATRRGRRQSSRGHQAWWPGAWSGKSVQHGGAASGPRPRPGRVGSRAATPSPAGRTFLGPTPSGLRHSPTREPGADPQGMWSRRGPPRWPRS